MQNIDPTSVFATISNPVRLRCLFLVATNPDVCVCEVEEALQIAQPAASKALNALKAQGIVTATRDANWSHYSLNDSMPDWLREIVNSTVKELSGRQPYRKDANRLRNLELRPMACD
jgi:ArsR family transcriptional regulator